MAATHIFDAPPEGVAADWTMPQNWRAFTAEQHETWRSLFDRQSAALDGYACRSFLGGLDILRKLKPGVPDFTELNALLKPVSGWEVVAVPGWIPNEPFSGIWRTGAFPPPISSARPSRSRTAKSPICFTTYSVMCRC